MRGRAPRSAASHAVPIPPSSGTCRLRSSRTCSTGTPRAAAIPPDGHRRVDQSERDRVAPHAPRRVGLRDRRRQPVDARLRHLVRNLEATRDRCRRRHVHDRSTSALSHRRQRSPTHPPHGSQVHVDDSFEGRRVGGVRRTVTTPADADDVDQDVEPTPRPARASGDDCCALLVVGDISSERGGATVEVADRRRRLLRTVGETIDAEHLGTLASERRRDRPTVADRVARRLAGTDHDRHEPTEPSLSHRPSVLNAACQARRRRRAERVERTARWSRGAVGITSRCVR